MAAESKSPSKEDLLELVKQAKNESWEKLDLSGRGITEPPKELWNLSNLTALNLSNNQISEIPKEIAKLTNLTKLHLTNNQLEELPNELWNLTKLTELHLDSNQISEIPKEIAKLTNLIELDLTNNQLSEIPKEIAKLINLTHFETWGNFIGELPKELWELTNLTHLDIWNSSVSEIPKEIAKLTKLTFLDMGSNQLKELPRELWNLSSLTHLKIWQNQLKELPDELGNLTKLTELHLDNNQISEISKEIAKLTNLTELHLDSNQISEIPKEIAKLTNLTKLQLDSNQISEIPKEIAKLTNLTELDLDNNQLEELPNELWNLTKLTELHLNINQISEIPKEIAKLTNLTKLDLTNNQISEIPKEIAKLTNLTKLDLTNNQISEIPKEIAKLTNLIELDLTNNQISEIPKEIAKLTNLTKLHLDSNQISEIPKEIAKLTNLIELDLTNNQISHIPKNIGNLKSLARLTLDSKKLNLAVQTAFNAGINELLTYLRSLKNAKRIYESKLIIIGEGGVGKTTLLNALTGQESHKDEPTTHGIEIDIQALKLKHPDKPRTNIQFNTWDFGGQEVYRITHQFFFSPRSIYLVVWEPRKGVQQCQVEDWLKMIRLRVGNEARVIIVSTHCKSGERIARIDKPVFMRDYGSMVVGFLEVDSMIDDPETGEKIGINQLKSLIANTAKDLSNVGMLLNRDWRKARDQLLKLNEPIISYNKFTSICHDNGLYEVATRALATLMHELGYIVYYGDDEQLRNDVVLQPQWLSKAIGFVLEDRKTNKMDGILPDKRLKEVWWEHTFKDQPRYQPELYPFFLRIMERYDVAYRLESGDASLVAQHVPQVRPKLPWLPEEEPSPNRRRIAMTCVMDDVPPGIVPWMIVRTHDYSFVQKEAKGKTSRLYWEKGMFLKKENHGTAMLELRGRELHIHAEAVWPEFFMNVLGQTLETLITDTWPGMKGTYNYAVPCREDSNGSICEGRFHIAALRDFLEEGDETIRCQDCRKRQNIVELLFGFEQEDYREQLVRIESKIDAGFEQVKSEIEGLESRIANYVMTILKAIASESKNGPRLFSIGSMSAGLKSLTNDRFKLQVWCEAEGCQHPVSDFYEGKGTYEFEESKNWVVKVAPYANFISGMLKTILPMVTPAVNLYFGQNTMDQSSWLNRLELGKAMAEGLPDKIKASDSQDGKKGLVSEAERAGVLALHSLLTNLDPNHEKLGLKRVPTYTGDYLWLCEKHYEDSRPKIPEKIEFDDDE